MVGKWQIGTRQTCKGSKTDLPRPYLSTSGEPWEDNEGLYTTKFHDYVYFSKSHLATLFIRDWKREEVHDAT